MATARAGVGISRSSNSSNFVAAPGAVAPALDDATLGPASFVEIASTEVVIDRLGRFYAKYILRIRRGGQDTLVPRRYKQFRDLHARLLALPPSQRPTKASLPRMTSRKWGFGVRGDVIEKRCRKLAEYLNELEALAVTYPAFGPLLALFFSESLAADNSPAAADEEEGDMHEEEAEEGTPAVPGSAAQQQHRLDGGGGGAALASVPLQVPRKLSQTTPSSFSSSVRGFAGALMGGYRASHATEAPPPPPHTAAIVGAAAAGSSGAAAEELLHPRSSSSAAARATPAAAGAGSVSTSLTRSSPMSTAGRLSSAGASDTEQTTAAGPHTSAALAQRRVSSGSTGDNRRRSVAGETLPAATLGAPAADRTIGADGSALKSSSSRPSPSTTHTHASSTLISTLVAGAPAAAVLTGVCEACGRPLPVAPAATAPSAAAAPPYATSSRRLSAAGVLSPSAAVPSQAFPSAAGGTGAGWDAARFCSRQCDVFWSAARTKGFSITAQGGRRLVQLGGGTGAGGDAASLVSSSAQPLPSAAAPTSSSRTLALMTSPTQGNISAMGAQTTPPMTLHPQGGAAGRWGGSPVAGSSPPGHHGAGELPGGGVLPTRASRVASMEGRDLALPSLLHHTGVAAEQRHAPAATDEQHSGGGAGSAGRRRSEGALAAQGVRSTRTLSNASVTSAAPLGSGAVLPQGSGSLRGFESNSSGSDGGGESWGNSGAVAASDALAAATVADWGSSSSSSSSSALAIAAGGASTRHLGVSEGVGSPPPPVPPLFGAARRPKDAKSVLTHFGSSFYLARKNAPPDEPGSTDPSGPTPAHHSTAASTAAAVTAALLEGAVARASPFGAPHYSAHHPGALDPPAAMGHYSDAAVGLVAGLHQPPQQQHNHNHQHLQQHQHALDSWRADNSAAAAVPSSRRLVVPDTGHAAAAAAAAAATVAGMQQQQQQNSGTAHGFTSPTSSSAAASNMKIEIVHHRGVMWKQGGFRGGRKTWKSRYFELKDRSLYYFRTSRPVLLGTMTVIEEPPRDVLLAAAAVLLQYGLSPSSPEFASALFQSVNGEEVGDLGAAHPGGLGLGDVTDATTPSHPQPHRYLASCAEVPPAVAEAQLSLPPELTRAAAIVGSREAARALGVRPGPGPYVFVVSTAARTLYLACETPESYVAWLSALRGLIGNETQRLLAMVRSSVNSGILAASLGSLGSPHGQHAAYSSQQYPHGAGGPLYNQQQQQHGGGGRVMTHHQQRYGGLATGPASHLPQLSEEEYEAHAVDDEGALDLHLLGDLVHWGGGAPGLGDHTGVHGEPPPSYGDEAEGGGGVGADPHADGGLLAGQHEHGAPYPRVSRAHSGSDGRADSLFHSTEDEEGEVSAAAASEGAPEEGGRAAVASLPHRSGTIDPSSSSSLAAAGVHRTNSHGAVHRTGPQRSGAAVLSPTPAAPPAPPAHGPPLPSEQPHPPHPAPRTQSGSEGLPPGSVSPPPSQRPASAASDSELLLHPRDGNGDGAGTGGTPTFPAALIAAARAGRRSMRVVLSGVAATGGALGPGGNGQPPTGASPAGSGSPFSAHSTAAAGLASPSARGPQGPTPQVGTAAAAAAAAAALSIGGGSVQSLSATSGGEDALEPGGRYPSSSSSHQQFGSGSLHLHRGPGALGSGGMSLQGSGASSHPSSKANSLNAAASAAAAVAAALSSGSPSATLSRSLSAPLSTPAAGAAPQPGGPPPTAAPVAPNAAWEVTEDEIEVVDRIGGGSFGEVYRGRLWGSDVAVKLLGTGDSVTAPVLDSLKAEVSILSQLRHPNVVLYLGACTTPPHIFIVTEWCERGSLHDLLYDRTIPLSVANRLGMALQTAQGMCYLHSARRSIIHRDLKSHNLLVTRDFSVKVADFGLTIVRSAAQALAQRGSGVPGDGGETPSALASAAAVPPSSAAEGGLSAASKDRRGGAAPASPPRGSGAPSAAAAAPAGEPQERYGVQGTPQWMAPEVMEGNRYGASVDVYSFGIVLCEIASRILPFSDTHLRFDFIDAVLEEGAIPTIPRWCHALPHGAGTKEWQDGGAGGAHDPPSIPRGRFSSIASDVQGAGGGSDLVQRGGEEGRDLGARTPGADPLDLSPMGDPGDDGVGAGDEAAVGTDGLPWGWREDVRPMLAAALAASAAAELPHAGRGASSASAALKGAALGAPLGAPQRPPPLLGGLHSLRHSGGEASLAPGGRGGAAPNPEARASFSDLEWEAMLNAGPRSRAPTAPMTEASHLPRIPSTPSLAPRPYPGGPGVPLASERSFAAPRGQLPGGGADSAPGASRLPPSPAPPGALVLGGVQEWRTPQGDCSGVLRALIESCLSRDPAARPSFDELVDLLRALLERSPRELFLQLELPRIREGLAYGDDTDAAVAANEIVHFASFALFSSSAALLSGGPLSRMAAASNGPSLGGRTPSNGPAAGGEGPNGGGGGNSGGGGGGEDGDVKPQTGLIPRFTPNSLSFYPLLPFASVPSSVMSGMHSVPYVDLPTVCEAGHSLLAGLAARLRHNDILMRARLGLPLYCPDIGAAVLDGPAAAAARAPAPAPDVQSSSGAAIIVVRDTDLGSDGARVGVHVPTYRAAVELAFASLQLDPGHPAPPPRVTTAPPGAGGPSKAAQRAAAAREEEERRRRRAAVSASAHIVHSLSVLLQVLDAASPAPSVVAEDNGLEPSSYVPGASAKLPPTDSIDRVLLGAGSRLVYSLVGLVATTAFSPTEEAFVTRPTGGSAAGLTYGPAAPLGVGTLPLGAAPPQTCFPSMPDFGADALDTAAGLLRALWSRIPLLRTPIAHAATVTALCMAATLGGATVQVTRDGGAAAPAATAAALLGSDTPRGAGASGASPASGTVTALVVQIPDEVVQARYLGVVADRLNGPRTPYTTSGGAGGAAGSGGVLSSRRHPLVAAVEQRLRGAVVRRVDGIILGAVDVEEYDETLC